MIRLYSTIRQLLDLLGRLEGIYRHFVKGQDEAEKDHSIIIVVRKKNQEHATVIRAPSQVELPRWESSQLSLPWYYPTWLKLQMFAVYRCLWRCLAPHTQLAIDMS
jgi:hypothetical protein